MQNFFWSHGASPGVTESSLGVMEVQHEAAELVLKTTQMFGLE